jgi:phage tail-like protein
MATIVNNRSSLITDPIRNFRFLVTFKPIGEQTTTTTTTTNQTGITTTVTNGTDSSTVTNPSALNATFGFTSFSGLSVTTDSIPYREGGYNTTVHQIPGQTTFAPIQLQRGVTLGTNANWNWMKQLFQVVQPTAGTGTKVSANQFRCDVEIQVLSHPIGEAESTDTKKSAGGDHVAMRFNIYNAWITSIAYSDLNAGDNALFVEQMTLVHEGFDVHWATDLKSSADIFS